MKLMTFSGLNLGELDSVIFHQANKFLNDCISKQMKLPPEKVLYSIDKYGNTSSASIPLTIVHRLVKSGAVPHRILLSGFGVGLSWASAIIDLTNCHICDLIEV
jgi:3-oxoacyl-[acyl-carrier-protein] synthase-3